MGFTVLIAGDEPVTLSHVSSLIGDDEELDVVGICRRGDQAATTIREQMPDIAFLDVDLPGMSGLEIADRFAGDDGPKIIFLSASEEHACRSFELRVFDYLVKPVRRERFRQSLERVKRALAQAKANRLSEQIAELVNEYAAIATGTRTTDDDCLVTRSGERLNRLAMSDIVWVEASNQYLTLHTEANSFVISQSLSGFLEEHQAANLCRVHRSHAVNLEAVEEVHRKSCGRTEVRLRNGTALSVSRSRLSVVPTLLKWAAGPKARRVG